MQKKLLACTLALLLVLPFVTPSADAAAMGDVDRDGSVTAADARLALRYAVGLEPSFTVEQAVAANVNADSTVDAADARLILRRAVGLLDAQWQTPVHLTLLNKAHKAPAEFTVTLAQTVGGVYLEQEAAAAYTRMYTAAYTDGILLTPMSGYRSFEHQERNYNALAAAYASYGYSWAEAYELAATEILPPGCSEHNYGLAMDIGWVADSFKDSAAYAWLVENAAAYGFIERYKEEKMAITGVIPEPWHWRYVGSPAIAESIRDSGKCLEEFLGIIH